MFYMLQTYRVALFLHDERLSIKVFKDFTILYDL